MKLNLINIYNLKNISFDSNLDDEHIISSLNRLLNVNERKYLSKNNFKNIDLIIGNSYQMNENGSVTIPWNWIE